MCRGCARVTPCSGHWQRQAQAALAHLVAPLGAGRIPLCCYRRQLLTSVLGWGRSRARWCQPGRWWAPGWARCLGAGGCARVPREQGGEGSWALPCSGAFPEQGLPSLLGIVQRPSVRTLVVQRQRAWQGNALADRGTKKGFGLPVLCPGPMASPARPKGRRYL